MNIIIINLIKRLNEVSALYDIPSTIKYHTHQLYYIIEHYENNAECEIFSEIKKCIFTLLELICNSSNLNRIFTTIFNDLIVEFIEQAEKEDYDISDLITKLSNVSISPSLDEQLSDMAI